MISDDLRKLENKKEKKSSDINQSYHVSLQQINSSPRQLKY